MLADLAFDGACRGNPGPSATGSVLLIHPDEIFEYGSYIGETTNNVAEYFALKYGVAHALDLGVTRLDISGDSLLVVNQVNQIWECRSPKLKPVLDDVLDLLDQFNHWSISHVRRDLNEEADALANRVLDEIALRNPRS